MDKSEIIYLKLKTFNRAKQDLSVTFFIHFIKPILHRHKWRLCWANGTCFIVDRNGNVRHDKSENLEQLAVDFFQDVKTLGYEIANGYYNMISPLWEVLCDIELQIDIILSKYGAYEIPCYNPEDNK